MVRKALLIREDSEPESIGLSRHRTGVQKLA